VVGHQNLPVTITKLRRMAMTESDRIPDCFAVSPLPSMRCLPSQSFALLNNA
jgi:hypothetical protein